MTKFSLSPLRLLLLSALGSALVLGGAFAGVMALWQPAPLGAFLPARETLAYFHNVSQEDLKPFLTMFPALRTFSQTQSDMDIGVIRMQDGRIGWVASAPAKSDVAGNMKIGRQEFLTSETDSMQKMLTGSGYRLRSLPSFRSLAAGLGHDARWIFVQSADAPVASLPPLLQPMIRGSGALLLAFDRATAMLRIYGQVPGPADQPIEQGMLTRMIADTVGGEWSYRYDLLPLIAAESSFSWRMTTGTGGTAFLLRSAAGNVPNLHRALGTLHDHFRTQFAESAVVRLTFDRRFTTTMLTGNPLQSTDREENMYGWAVRQTQAREGRVLFSAIRGRQFIVTNTEDWLLQSITTDGKAPFPGPLGDTPASPLFEQWNAGNRQQPGWQWLESVFPPRTPVLWSVERDRQGTTLSLTLSAP